MLNVLMFCLHCDLYSEWLMKSSQIGLIHTKVLILEYLNQHNGEKWYGYNHTNDSLTCTSNWQSFYTDE